MIKFFRHIRQRMLSENKLSKYLLYATGEILLVVIGILIALQLNEWKSNEQDKAQETKILVQLNADLRANLQEVQDINTAALERSAACDSIMLFIAERRPINDSLKKYLEEMDIDALFNNANTTYRYIQSQGTNFLRNDSIRNRITIMYERDFQNIFSRQEMSWQIVVDELRPTYDRLLRVDSMITFDFSPYTVNTPRDIEVFYQDQTLKNVIARMRLVTGVRTTWLSITLKKLEALIEDIDAEISKLNS